MPNNIDDKTSNTEYYDKGTDEIWDQFYCLADDADGREQIIYEKTLTHMLR